MTEWIGRASIYAGILVAAAVEGELAFVAASAMVWRGLLSPVGVVLAGATGAALGDQFYFYLLRGRLDRWLGSFPRVTRAAAALAAAVRRHDTVMVLAIRFSPGLRIALAAACAYAGVPAMKFSALDTLSSLVWAAALLALIAYLGPRYLSALGISGWWSAVIPALIVVLMFRTLRGVARNTLSDAAERSET